MSAIFIDMFAPKWARGLHNLARFFSFFFLKHDSKIDNNIKWKENRLNVLAFSFEKAVMQTVDVLNDW